MSEIFVPQSSEALEHPVNTGLLAEVVDDLVGRLFRALGRDFHPREIE